MPAGQTASVVSKRLRGQLWGGHVSTPASVSTSLLQVGNGLAPWGGFVAKCSQLCLAQISTVYLARNNACGCLRGDGRMWPKGSQHTQERLGGEARTGSRCRMGPSRSPEVQLHRPQPRVSPGVSLGRVAGWGHTGDQPRPAPAVLDLSGFPLEATGRRQNWPETAGFRCHPRRSARRQRDSGKCCGRGAHDCGFLKQTNLSINGKFP